MELLEGQAKRFLNMIPRPFYTEAAQKMVHEICETIYKELPNNGDKIPRKEIIEIVENFIKKHLENPPENPEENPTGIRDAIADSLAKNTLEIYKDDIMMMLLLKKIIEGDMDKKESGIFYKSLKDSVSIAKDPTILNRIGRNLKNTKDNINQKLKENIINPINQGLNSANNFLNNKKKEFAKNTMDSLIDSTMVTAVQQGGDPDGEKKPEEKPEEKKEEKKEEKEEKPDAGGISGLMGDVAGKISDANDSVTSKIGDVKDSMSGMTDSLKDTIGNVEANLGGKESSNITNVQYDPNQKYNPLAQVNCNGSGLGLGLPNVDLNFLGKLFDGLKEPLAKELVKKIQERLPDKTVSSLVVKRDIYNKILLVIESHLKSDDGKKMLLKHIDGVIQNEIRFLTQDDRPMKERLLKVILKNKSSKLYKKMIDIIAENSEPIGGNVKPNEEKPLISGGADNEIPLIFDVNIQNVINQLLEWMKTEITPELNHNTIIPNAEKTGESIDSNIPIVQATVQPVNNNSDIPIAEATVIPNNTAPDATAPDATAPGVEATAPGVEATASGVEATAIQPNESNPPTANDIPETNEISPIQNVEKIDSKIDDTTNVPPPPDNTKGGKNNIKRITKKRKYKINKKKTLKRNQTKRSKNKRKQKTNKNNRK